MDAVRGISCCFARRCDANMVDSVNRALAEHKNWLRRLRWVSSAERVLLWLVVAGVLTVAVLGVVLGHGQQALLVSGAHVLLLIAAVILTSRRASAPLLALVIVSLLNYCIALLGAFPGWRLVAWAYTGLGVVAAILAFVGWLRLRARWSEVSSYRERDHYRWLLTEAPLILRHRIAAALAKLDGEGVGDSD